MIKLLAAMLLASLIVTTTSRAADTSSINADSGSFTLKKSDGSTLLSAGTAADGDGSVLQIGYYSGASISAGSLVNPFSGTFVPLTGVGSLNTAYNTTSIGDFVAFGGGANGTFATGTLLFTVGSLTTGNSFPAAGTPLSIKFFDTTTIIPGTSFYNSVSDALWVWRSPATPTDPASPNMSLDTAGLVWQGTPFVTSLAVAVPEPSTYAFALVGLLGAAFAKRFRRS
jgi:hypothetical protein